MMDINSHVVLNNGVEMPILGFGVFKLNNGKEVEKAVLTALKNGYRSIDTAQAYHNEKGVGKAIKASGIDRKKIFLTTKVKNDFQGYESTMNAFHQSLEELQTDYLDLYLVHWPKENITLETWKAMEELYDKGLVRAIGVSNFKIHHLEHLLSQCNIQPAVNQIEFHPEHTQPRVVEYCNEKNIQVEAWGPLMGGKINQVPLIKKLAKKYGKSPAQIVLRWEIQKGVVTIPKSARAERIISNTEIFDFELSAEDMVEIDTLNRNNSRIIHFDKYMYILEMLGRQRNMNMLKMFFKATVHKTRQKIKTSNT